MHCREQLHMTENYSRMLRWLLDLDLCSAMHFSTAH